MKDNNGTVITDWIPETPQKETRYIFEGATYGIVAGQTYKVSMQAVDLVGNIREANK